MYAVPMLGPYVLLTDVIGGRPLGAGAVILSAATCLLAAAVLLRISTGLFRNERIIFGR
jgi:hypothetical protein